MRLEAAPTANNVVAELVGEIKLGLSTCIFFLQYTSPRGCATSLLWLSRHSAFSQSGLRMHPSCHQPDVVHGWLQVAAIGTAVPETDIFACSTFNLSVGDRIRRRLRFRSLWCPSVLMLPLYVSKVSTGVRFPSRFTRSAWLADRA